MTTPFPGRVSLRELASDVASLKAGGGLSPIGFGAIGDGASHPAVTKYASLVALQAVYPFATDLSQELDYLGWQAALNHGGAVACTGLESFVMCNAAPTSMTPLIVIAGQSWVDCHGAHFDWSALRPAAVPEPLNQDPTFQLSGAASPWINSTLYPPDQISDVVVANGAATYTDPTPWPPTVQSGGHFFSFGQQVTIPPGRYRVTIEYSVTLGASYASGNFNPPYAFINLQTQVGNGNNPVGVTGNLQFPNLFEGGGSASASFDFAVSETLTAFLCVQGGQYANVEITAFYLRPWTADCAMLLTRDGAAQYYPIFQPFSGFTAQGPSRQYAGLAAARWKSFVQTDGNVAVLDKTVISGFDGGLSLEDGSYLTEMFGVEVNDCGTCIQHPPGVNSGENYRFYGGGFNNSGTVLENSSGAEYHFYGSSFDYNQYVVRGNAGRVEFHGGRAEQNPPYTGGPGGPVYECIGNGSIDWQGGYILLTSDANDPPVHLQDATSKMRLHGTQLYSLGSKGGFAVSGLGVLSAPGGWVNGGNTSVGPSLLSAARSMDVFGGGGSFEPHDQYYPFAGEAVIGLQGGLYPNDPTTATGQWTGTDVTCEVSTEHAHSGTRSLKVTKTTSYEAGYSGAQLVFLIPVRTGQDVWFTGQILAPDAVGEGVSTIYFRAFFCQVVGYDSHQRPIFGQGYDFRGEPPNDVPIDLTGATSWKPFSVNMAYASAQATPYTTHMAVVLDNQVLPAMSVYLDDLVANVL